MALTSILRKSASSLAPLAGRLVRCQRNCHSALFTAITHTNVSNTLSSLVPNLHYSSASKRPSSDQTLLRVIESEIQCLQETDDHDRVEKFPSDFPFEIEDNPGLQTLTLKRTYQGEEIEVEVHMPDHEKASQSCLPLVVSVSMKGAPSLEFSCISYPDQIEIESLAVKHPESSEDEIAYKGPNFLDLDEDLQKAFNRYLKMRGIKPSTINFLHEYMINKNSKEELIWMKKLKKFIEA
ncbi:Mitochondrial glycoprotein [Fagus crenata]